MARKTVTPEDKVRKAYAQAGGSAGEFVKLNQMRYILCGMGLNFTEQDGALAGMYRRQEINLVPQDNQAALTRDERATAMHLGGEDKHLVSIR